MNEAVAGADREPRGGRGGILLCGATGLVGGECLRLLLRDPRFGRIVTLSRRRLPREVRESAPADRLEEHVVDFDHLGASTPLPPLDRVICALGTTIRRAGSRERFRQVDHGYPLAVAKRALKSGARHFLLVSAIGADPRSRFFYNRVKGEVEAAVTALPYRSVTLVRPSLLLGERDEFRLGEEIARRFRFLAPARYAPVSASDVAAAILQAAIEDRAGRRVIESREIPAMAEEYLAGSG